MKEVPTESLSQNGAGLRTAASLRDRTRRLDRQPTEVTWVANDGANTLYVVVSLLLAGLALLLIAAALYLR